MRRLFLIALAFLAFATADARALSIAQRVNVLNQCPAQVLKPTGQPCASVDANLATQKYWARTHGYLVASSLLAISRASAETTTDCNNNVGYVNSNVLAVTCAGLQAWQGTTNYLLHSNDISQWNYSNASGVANAAAAPDGTTSATAVTYSTTAGIVAYGDGPTYGTNTFTGSVYLQASAPVTLALRLSSDGVGYVQTQNVNVTTVWQRFSVTGTGSSGDTGGVRFDFSLPSSIAPTVYAWGGQLAELGFVDPLCPTTASTCTRAADNITATGALLAALNSGNVSVIGNASQTQSGFSQQPYLLGFGSNHGVSIINSSFGVPSENNGTSAVNGTGFGAYPFLWKLGSSNSPAGRIVGANGLATGSDSNNWGTGSSVYIGSNTAANSFLDANLQRLTAFTPALNALKLQNATNLP